MDTKSNSDIEFVLTPFVPPWPEWSDADLNAEKWELPKATKVASKLEIEDNSVLRFVDPTGHCEVPCSIRNDVASYEQLEIDGIIVPKEGEAGRPTMDYDGGSPAIQRIVTAVSMLTKISLIPPAPIIEDAGNNYCPITTTWKPWHHVYSNCKAGKGQLHKPIMNSYGKYLIRLFYLGSWRRIAIDSFIPTEADGHFVLPSSGLALWPQLLTKALLKIAALSWTDDDELVGWDPLTCLTGWCPVTLCCSLFPPFQLWKMFIKLLPNSEQDDKQQPHLLAEDIRLLETALARSPQSKVEGNLVNYEVPTCPKNLLDPEAESMGPINLVADLKNVGTILLMSVVVKRNPEHDMARPPTPRWKTYRWKEWAIRSGIIQEPPPPTIRFLTVFTTETNPLPDVLKAIKVEPVNPKTGAAKKMPKAISKSSLGIQVDGQEVILSFEAILQFIGDLSIYLRPSSFSKSVRVNSLATLQPSPEDVVGTGRESIKPTAFSYTSVHDPVIRPKIMSCFYLLFDSEFYKNLFVSVTSLSERRICRIEQNILHSRVSEDIDEKNDPECLPTLLAEQYDWRGCFSGTPVSRVISSSKTPSVISLGPGMNVLRCWFSHVPQHFSILLASQSPFLIGNREVVVERMQQGSLTLRNYESALTKAMLNLVGKTPKTKEHQAALEAFHFSYLPPSVKALEEWFNSPVSLSMKSHLPPIFATASRLYGEDIVTRLSFILEIASLLTDVEFEISHLSNRMRRELQEADSFCEALRNRISDTAVQQSDKKKGKTDGSNKSHISRFLEEPGTGLFLLRQILSKDNEVLQLYPFKDDLNSSIYYDEFKGTYRYDVFQKWAPLFRLNLNHCILADERPTCAIHTTVNTGGWEVRVTDTKTLCDSTNFGKEPRPFVFKQGDSYSVLCYVVIGAIRSKDIQWNIRISGLDRFSTPHNCSTPDKGNCKSLAPRALSVKELVDYYIPNSKRIIGKTVIAYSERLVLSLRFVMSCPTVDFVVKVSTEQGLIREFRGKGELVLPYLELDCENSKSTEGEKEAFMEIVMVGDSWRLGFLEQAALKSVIENAKKRRLVFTGSEESIQRFGSRSTPSIRMERKSKITFRAIYPDDPVDNAAIWSVAIAIDSSLYQNVRLDLDRRQENDHRKLKLDWEAECPGRFKKGQKLREEFLELMYLAPHMIYKHDGPLFIASAGEEKNVTVLDEKAAIRQTSEIRKQEKLFFENYEEQRRSCTRIMEEQTSNLLKLEEYLDNLIEITKSELMEVYICRFEAITEVRSF